MKILCFLLTILLFVQCSNSSTNNKQNGGIGQNERLSLSNMTLSGIGESGIAGFYNDWTIKILDNSLIEMLCSLKKDSLDSRSMNRQYFGHLIHSDIYDYKVIIDRALYIDDCNAPDDSSLKTDTIPLYIDSALFKYTKYWDLKFKTIMETDTVVRITSTYYPLVFKGDGELIMTLYPDENSGYYPISIRTKKNCKIDIANFQPEMEYYFDKSGNNYELISDITTVYNMQNKKCDYCIKRMKLKILK